MSEGFFKRLNKKWSMNELGTVELLGMEFHAYHGCLESEREKGNTFIVDFYAEIDVDASGESDALADTLDYGKVYKIIAGVMQNPSCLLENVVKRILDALVANAEIEEKVFFMKVSVSKKNPPVGGVCAWSRVSRTYGDSYLEQ